MCVVSSASTRWMFELQHAAHYQAWIGLELALRFIVTPPPGLLLVPFSLLELTSAIAGLLCRRHIHTLLMYYRVRPATSNYTVGTLGS
ncbi:hypothetical protein BR93DRAFT_268032 [Coniochaeta sp. PMI_546]|nr:hypothetical protein BR93DRAFT_268032 [Coniochaeta sp. PMI_546]